MSGANVPRNRKLAVWRRDGFQCRYCRRLVTVPNDDTPRYLWATVDHVQPRSKGGTNDIKNLVTSCEPCNTHKADFVPPERCRLIDLSSVINRAREQGKRPEPNYHNLRAVGPQSRKIRVVR